MFLTLDQEVEAIWTRKFTLTSLLYIVMRISTLAWILLDIGSSLPIFGPPTILVGLMSVRVSSFKADELCIAGVCQSTHCSLPSADESMPAAKSELIWPAPAQ